MNVCDLHVGDGLFSWHLPVEMSLTSIYERPNVNNVILEGEEKIIWCDAYVQSYKNEQDSSHFKECLGKARSLLDVDVNGAVEQLVKSLYGAAACMIKTVGKGRQACNSWFDIECKQKKREVNRLLQRFQRCKQQEEKDLRRKEYVKARKEYITLRKGKEHEFNEARIHKLKDATHDSKTFWSTIRSVTRKAFVYNNISIEQWLSLIHI